ncbi:unnamed protein product [Parascedosporium putredinis]|uniref:Uncharacterized protein n=1 Tax=Parascedosporium putredinis TaxID=1442378 RepID=A0A9P1H035_9PEZI|nr:unnamed protein product [Parascedosporium putredinis]CAI7992293.1 unnamed protein product [Parascedosporium putredinis]
MAKSQLLVSLLAALAAAPPSSQYAARLRGEVRVQEVLPRDAAPHLGPLSRASHGLGSWSDAIFYFFGGRPYPGTWDGVDDKGESREIMRMEYTDVPATVKKWIEEQKKIEDPEAPSKHLFAVYEKPQKEGDKITGTAKPRPDGTEAADEEKVLMFAAGALYEILPLWVADGSDCQDELLNLENYQAWPEDKKIVAWPVEHTWPDDESGNREIEFTVKAQILHETEEGRVARLQREKEAEEERIRQEEEAKRLAEEEAQKAAEEAAKEAEEEGTNEEAVTSESEAPAVEEVVVEKVEEPSAPEAEADSASKTESSEKDEL